MVYHQVFPSLSPYLQLPALSEVPTYERSAHSALTFLFSCVSVSFFMLVLLPWNSPTPLCNSGKFLCIP